MTRDRDIRVVVVDDSAFNRQTITSMLSGVGGVAVVGRAGDGNEGLRLALEREPDVITLDLEMPRMDGFTFLRILMRRRPTPVIVISSHARQENVFKALELGALDFIAKPTVTLSPELRAIEAELVDKVLRIGRLQRVSLTERVRPPEPAEPAADRAAPAAAEPDAPLRVACIGASTGGPPALKQVLGALPAGLPIAVLVSQHMPAGFTAAFAERLDAACALDVREARSGDRVRAGRVLVAPGGASLAVERNTDGGVRVRVEAVDDTERAWGRAPRYLPSIDRMMQTAAAVVGGDVLGIVLTGMGDDGADGVRAIRRAGGATVAEAQETAVIFGMPEEAIRTGAVDEVLPLSRIADRIVRHARARR